MFESTKPGKDKKGPESTAFQRRHGLADTLTSDFSSLELWENAFLIVAIIHYNSPRKNRSLIYVQGVLAKSFQSTTLNVWPDPSNQTYSRFSFLHLERWEGQVNLVKCFTFQKHPGKVKVTIRFRYHGIGRQYIHKQDKLLLWIQRSGCSLCVWCLVNAHKMQVRRERTLLGVEKWRGM